MDKIFGVFQTISMRMYAWNIRKKHIMITLGVLLTLVVGRIAGNLIGEYRLSLLAENKYMQALDSQLLKELSCDDSFVDEYMGIGKTANVDEQASDGKYSSHKLIVITDKDNFETYGATKDIQATNMHVLQYDSDNQTKYAYENLLQNENITYVELDSTMSSGANDEELIEDETQDVLVDEDENKYIETELKKYLDTLEATKEIKVAVIDTGVSGNDEVDIIDILPSNANYSNSGEDYSSVDDNGHGTEIAEIILKNSNAKILPIKIANKEGKSTVLSTYLGIKNAIANNVDVINISMNTAESSKSAIITTAIKEATEKGIVVVVSAGNLKSDVKNITPANIDSAIVVSAMGKDNKISKYSNHGDTVDYTSYGVYKEKEGTSYAAAQVAGIIADALSKGESTSVLDNYLFKTDNYKDEYGKGIVSLHKYVVENPLKEEDEEEITNYDMQQLEEDYKALQAATKTGLISDSNGSYDFKYIIRDENKTGANDSNIAAITSVSTKTRDGNCIIPSIIKQKEGSKTYTLKVVVVGNGSTAVCNPSKNVKFLGNVRIIAPNAFYNATNLQTVTIPSPVTIIGNGAFNGCKSLTKVTMEKSVTEIRDNAFKGCIKLSTLTIGENVTKIGDGAFQDCSMLTKVTIPKKVISLGYNTFRGSTPLKELTIQGDIPNNNNAFQKHTTIESLTVNEACTTIYDSMFEGCTKIQKMNLKSNKLITIGERAFYGCSGLCQRGSMDKSDEGPVSYPNYVKSVGKYAFRFYGDKGDAGKEPETSVVQSAVWTDKANGIAKVTIEAKASSVSASTAKDYVVIIDTSSSMNAKIKLADGSQKAQMDMEKDALNKFLDKIAEDGTNSRVCIIGQGNGEACVFKHWTIINSGNVNQAKNYISENLNCGTGRFWGESAKASNNMMYISGGNGSNYAIGMRLALRAIQNKESNNNTYVMVIGNFEEADIDTSRVLTAYSQDLKGAVENIWTIGVGVKGSNYEKYAKTIATNETYYANVATNSSFDTQISDTLVNAFNSSIICAKNASLTSTLNTKYWNIKNANGLINSNETLTKTGIDLTPRGVKYEFEIQLKDEYKEVSMNFPVSNNITSTYNAIADTKNSQNRTKTNTASIYLDRYLLKVDPNGGTWENSSTMQVFALSYNETMKISVPTIAGYRFKGWALTGSGAKMSSLTEEATFTMGAAEAILTATYEEDKYTVTYIGNGATGGSTETQTFMNGSSVKISENGFTKADDEFLGWNTKSDGTGTTYLVGQEYSEKANLTLFALWKTNIYTIAFDGNGATNGNTASQNAEYGRDIKLNKNGFELLYRISYDTQGGDTLNDSLANAIFTNWSTSPEGKGINYADEQQVESLVESGTAILYAQWTNPQITLPIPTKEGHTFLGWYKDEECTETNKVGNGGDVYTVVENITLYAKWVENTYDIEFKPNGATNGSMSTMENIKYSEKVELAENNFRKYYYTEYNSQGGEEVESVEIECQFIGWNKLGEGYSKNNRLSDKQTVSKLAESGKVTLYAQWENVEIILPAIRRTGYQFGGWYKDQACTETSRVGNSGDKYIPVEDMILYAKWTPNTYNIAYDGNGNTSGNVAAQTNIKYDTNVTLNANEFKRIYNVTYNSQGGDNLPLKQVSYKFKNWSTSPDNNGSSYNDKSIVRNLSTSGTKTLYAIWTADSITLQRVNKEGYTFTGWYLDEECTEANKVGDEGDEFIPTSDITLYAGWLEKEGTRYKVEYYKQNTQFDEYELAVTEIRSGKTNTVADIEPATLDGFEFDSNNENNVMSGIIEANGSLVLKLYYNRLEYDIEYHVNGGQISGVYNPRYTYGTATDLPTNVIKEGSAFDGWYRNSELTDGPVNQTDLTQFGQADYYAKWVENPDTTYVIEHYKQKSSLRGYELAERETKAGNSNTSAIAQPKTYLGFSFDETNYNNALRGNIASDGSLTLRVFYKRDVYGVNLNTNGGTVNEGNVESYTYGIGALLPNEEEVSKEGCNFIGWFMDEELTLGPITEIPDNNIGNIELYAKWETNVYSVVFKDYDGSIKKVQNVEHGNSAEAPLLNDIDGYTYKWDTDYSNVTSDLEVTANWIPNTNTPYIIEYYFRTRDWEVETYERGYSEVAYGTTNSEVSIEMPREFRGFTFNQNNPNSVLTGTVSGDGSLILRVFYTRNIYTINYELNGGTSKGTLSGRYMFGKAYTLNNNVRKEGHVFMGWYDNANCEGEPVTRITETDIGNKTFYAKWSEDGVYEIRMLDYEIDNEGFVVNVTADTTIKEFLNKVFTNASVKVYDLNGREMTEKDFIGTGYTIRATYYGVNYNYIAVVQGDINGDGRVTNADIILANEALSGKITLGRAAQKAVISNEDGQLTMMDIIKMNQLIQR